MANEITTKKTANDIRDLILSDSAKSQFAAALPKHLKPDRFIRIAITAITRTPKLMECTKESLLSCLLDLSQLGLEPDSRKAHLIPYGNKCTLIIDYKGLVDLARRSGEISDIHADVVCENDSFEYSFGTDGKLIHKPAIADRGKPVAAYSFVKLKDGSSSYEVMNEEEIKAIWKRSKAASSGPWVTDWNEMAKKTVFRRHSKWLPVSSEFLSAVEKDYDVPIDIVPAGKPEVEMPKEVEAADQEPKVGEAEQIGNYISGCETCKSKKDLDNYLSIIEPEAKGSLTAAGYKDFQAKAKKVEEMLK